MSCVSLWPDRPRSAPSRCRGRHSIVGGFDGRRAYCRPLSTACSLEPVVSQPCSQSLTDSKQSIDRCCPHALTVNWRNVGIMYLKCLYLRNCLLYCTVYTGTCICSCCKVKSPRCSGGKSVNNCINAMGVKSVDQIDQTGRVFDSHLRYYRDAKFRKATVTLTHPWLNVIRINKNIISSC